MTLLHAEAGDIAVYGGDQAGPCTSVRSILDAAHPAAAMQGFSQLTATINPATRPGRGVPHSLCFAIEIVERIKLVGRGLSTPGVTPREKQVGGKPAVRQTVSGRGN